MARRQPKPNRRCRNCPDTPESIANKAASKAAAQVVEASLEKKIITVKGEGQRLWNHVLFGTSGCIGIMQGYVEIGMPGDPLPQLQQIIDLLTALKTKIENQHADRNPTK